MRTVGAAAPGAALSADGAPWQACAFPGTWRRSQQIALDADERGREAGRATLHLVLPPGSGKTAVGLEVARRRARRTLVLVPNGAVQAQWLAQWAAFALPGADAHPVPAAAELAGPPAALTVVPYAELAVRHPPADQDEPGPPAGQGDLLVQLDPAVRDLLERAGRSEPWLLVLDECAPSELRGAVASAVREALGRGTEVVGLGSTLPQDLPPGRRELAAALLGEVDVHVPVPVAVRDGDVAAYQELVLHCAPTPAEQDRVDAESEQLSALTSSLLAGRGSRPLLDWLARRLAVRPHEPWTAVERAEPELARAGLRLVATGTLPLPPGAWLREEHRAPLDADDWGAVLEQYAADALAPSREPEDAALLDDVLAALPHLGRGPDGRRTVAPVDRLCAGSLAKVEAAQRVLLAEHAVLGEDLRALLLCDTEDSPPSRGATRATLSALFAVDLLAAGPAGGLRPVLVTGRRVAAAPDVAQELRRWCGPQGAPGLRSVPLSGTGLYQLASDRPGWTARTWTPLVTAFLAAGHTSLLVGTPALLGEGWDCPPLQVVVDLGTGSAAAAARARGRGLRRDPARPDDVTDVWGVVCVADGSPSGGRDHARAVQRHATCFAPDPAGELVAGLGHADPALRPWTPLPATGRAAADDRALARPGRRERARQAWQVGRQPPGAEVVSLRVRTERDLGLAGRVVPPAALRVRGLLAGGPEPLPSPVRAPEADDGEARLWPAPAASAAVVGSAVAAVDPLVGLSAGALAAGATGAVLGGVRSRRQARALHAEQQGGAAGTTALRQLAATVADALHAVGDAPRGADGVDLQAGEDGEVRCELQGVPAGASAAWADALEELLLPLAEPRWVVARPVVPRPADTADARRLSRARALRRPVDALLAWHAVPQALADGPERVEAFATAWRRHVGPARLVRCREEEGRALLDLLRGADPFGVSVRRVRVWR